MMRSGTSALLVALSILSCGGFSDPTRDSIKVEVNRRGGATGDMMAFLTSTEFFARTDAEGTVRVQVFSTRMRMDTLPFTRTWDIREPQRFLFQVVPTDSLATVPVDLRVFLDSDLRFAVPGHNATNDDPAQFLFLFDQELRPDFVLCDGTSCLSN